MNINVMILIVVVILIVLLILQTINSLSKKPTPESTIIEFIDEFNAHTTKSVSLSHIKQEEYDEITQQIKEVFGTNTIPQVTAETAKIYLAFLKENFAPQFYLAGTNPFAWEEAYDDGKGDIEEYEALKAEQASYLDDFTFVSFDDELTDEFAIQVKVRRVKDGREFVIPFPEMMPNVLAEDDLSPEDDKMGHDFSNYVTWFWDYGLGWDEQQRLLNESV